VEAHASISAWSSAVDRHSGTLLFFAALAVKVNTRRVIENHVLDTDRDDFGDTGARVIEHGEQCAVALPGPAGRFRSIGETASISSRERKPSIGLSKRFIGTAKACSMMGRAFRS